VEGHQACSELVEVVLLSIPDLKVRVVPSAGEARRAMASNGRYSLVITDIHLPDEDGLALIRAIRAMPDGDSVPVMVITSSREAAREARRITTLGIREVLEKPFSPARLLEAVNSILNDS
jgi:two-component system chemotaxis response regulator CheY